MDRLCIKLFIKLNILPLMPLLSSLVNKPWRQTISKAFTISKKMAHSCFPCFDGFVDLILKPDHLICRRKFSAEVALNFCD